jgi:signal transduction histidine kinase
MAGTVADLASAAAVARLERRLRTMTQAVLLADDRRTALKEIATQARQAARAGVAAVLVHDADGFEVVVAHSTRCANPSPELMESLFAGAHARPELVEISSEGLGMALVARTVASSHTNGVLMVARGLKARPFRESDANLIAPLVAETSLILTIAAARRELERGVLAKDRNRIARELHDGVIQSLYGIGLVIEGIRKEAVRQGVKDQLSGLTESINHLTPQRLAKRGLGPELCSLAKEFQACSGVAAAVRLNGAIDDIGAEMGRDLIQIAREALSNVAKHASATKVVLSLRRGAQTIRLEVADDGRGMTPENMRGRGLPNILRRAQAWGGTLEIRPLHGSGMAIRVVVPARATQATNVATDAESADLAIAG